MTCLARFENEIVDVVLRRKIDAIRSHRHICWINAPVMTRLLVRRLQADDFHTNPFLTTINRTASLLESKCDQDTYMSRSHDVSIICRAAIDHLGPDRTAELLVYGNEEISQGSNELESLIIVAILNNDAAFLRYLLRESVDVHIQTKYFGAPLTLAAKEGHYKVILELLEHGADPNHKEGKDATALRSSCQQGHQTIVQLLLDPKYRLQTSGKNYVNAIKDAATAGHTGLVRYLIDNGSLENLPSLLQETLWITANTGNEEILRMVINLGVDLNAEKTCKTRALEIAARQGHLSIVTLLFEHGANLNYRGQYMSALHHAAGNGDESMAGLLLDHGADINYSGTHGPPLWEATYEQHLGMIQLLLDRGADLNSDECGDYCLRWAVRHGRENVVRLLAQAGVDVDATFQVELGEPPPILDAIMHGHSRIVEVLLELGAKPLDLWQSPWAERFRKGEYPSYIRTRTPPLLDQ